MRECCKADERNILEAVMHVLLETRCHGAVEEMINQFHEPDILWKIVNSVPEHGNDNVVLHAIEEMQFLLGKFNFMSHNPRLVLSFFCSLIFLSLNLSHSLEILRSNPEEISGCSLHIPPVGRPVPARGTAGSIIVCATKTSTALPGDP